MRRQTEMTHAYQPNVLVDTTNLSRDEWLAYRRYGIGGSDAAAILGISPWRTARDLYYDKLGIAEVSENEDNWVQLEMGNLLEPLVAQIFEKKTGLKVFKRKAMFQHPKYPWMLADLDYLVELPDGSTAILEIKTTNYNARDKCCFPIPPANTVMRVKTADMMIPQEARDTYRFRDNLIRFVAVGYDLPQTDSIQIDMDGKWVNGKYGVQLQVEHWREAIPPTIDGIRSYLSSGLLKGIGPKTAAVIVDRFGLASLDVIENHPERLLEIRGITEEKLEEIKNASLFELIRQPPKGPDLDILLSCRVSFPDALDHRKPDIGKA